MVVIVSGIEVFKASEQAGPAVFGCLSTRAVLPLAAIREYAIALGRARRAGSRPRRGCSGAARPVIEWGGHLR